MSKSKKFLYVGIAMASLLTTLVSVFSPPKQPAEKTVESPKTEVGTAKTIEDGPNQMEQWQRNVEAARMQREANEELAKWIQAEKDDEQAAQEELDKAERIVEKPQRMGRKFPVRANLSPGNQIRSIRL